MTKLIQAIMTPWTSSEVVEARASRLGLLRQAKRMGFQPKTIIDVGAAFGSFGKQARAIFPDARMILVEPLEEYKDVLESFCHRSGAVEYVRAAAYRQGGEATINVHADLEGSSLYLESEDSDVNGTARRVPAITLDGLRKERTLEAPLLLKVDVQGAELEVLRGGEGILDEAEYVLLEVSCFEFFKGGPVFSDVIEFMRSHGFVVFDVCDFQYRPLDNSLSQLDISFVKEKGMFRRNHYYATREQREEQNRRFIEDRKRKQTFLTR